MTRLQPRTLKEKPLDIGMTGVPHVVLTCSLAGEPLIHSHDDLIYCFIHSATSVSIIQCLTISSQILPQRGKCFSKFLDVFSFSWWKFDNFPVFHGNIFWWGFCFCQFVCLLASFHFLIVLLIKPFAGSLLCILRRWVFWERKFHWDEASWTYTLCSHTRSFAQSLV